MIIPAGPGRPGPGRRGAFAPIVVPSHATVSAVFRSSPSVVVAVLLATGGAGLTGCGQPSTPVPTVSEAPANPAPTPTPTPSPSLDRKAFCRTAAKHSAAAVDAISALVEHPDGKGLTVRQFEDARADLSVDAGNAPADLQPDILEHVRVLDQVVAVFATGQNEKIATGDLRDAAVRLLLACGSTTS